MQVCTSLQTDNHASTPPLFFTGRMLFLLRNQQCQSTEGKMWLCAVNLLYYLPYGKGLVTAGTSLSEAYLFSSQLTISLPP